MPESQSSKKTDGSASAEYKKSPYADFLNAQPTLVAWLLFLGFGTAFLASYYSQIRCSPCLSGGPGARPRESRVRGGSSGAD